jgi:thioredoxin 1
MDFNKILNENNVVVVKFSATWCTPCRVMEPTIENAAKQFEGKAKIMSIDVEEEPDLATKYKIRNVPTILYFKNGEIKDKSVGAMNESDLFNRINNLIEQ